MTLSMPFDKQRKQLIRQQMKQQESDAGGKEKLPHEKTIVKGKAERYPVYSFPLDDLSFNKANGRIKAEVVEKESELGRMLSHDDKVDQNIIRDILLSLRPDENIKIKEDLRKHGQMIPGIITCDGMVINGNRRKAILETLYDETKQEKYGYLEAQVLPSAITRAELWLIEAGIQLSTPQQLDYSPINHLLKLREGINAGLDTGDMASRIYGVSEDQLKDDLTRLDLIDDYLQEFLQKVGKYYLVKQRNEHFIDLQKILSWARTPKGPSRRDWQWDENDINELKLVAFYFIRIPLPHLRIRGLRELFATKEAWLQVKKVQCVGLGLSKDEKAETGLDDEYLADEEDHDITEDKEGPTTAVEERDLREETIWRKNRTDELKAFYEDAKEQEQIIKDSERPLALAKRALKNIKAIPPRKSKLGEPELDEVFSKIIEQTNNLRKIIKKQNKGRSKRRKIIRKKRR